jgi:uncharacterized membrane protein
MSTHAVATSTLPLAWRARLPRLLVWGAAVGYFCLATYFSLRRHDAYRSGIDLANFDQALWLLSQGEEPFVTQHGRPYWGDHFGLTPLLLVPLYVIGAGAGTLLVVQALAVAAVAPLLYALARAYGAGTWLAAIPALLWLASPLTLIPNLVDFHHVPFAAPLIVASILALKLDRLVLFGVLAVLACCAKEDIPLMYVMVGLVVALEGRRRLGAVISAGALALFAFAVLVFIPSFSNSLEWFAARFGGDRGDSLTEVAAWMLTHPLATVEDVLTAEHLVILVALVLSTGGLCLLGARWLLLGLPALAQNFLSAYDPQHALSDHYYVPVALAFSIAAAAGVHRLTAISRPMRLLATAGIVLAVAAFPFGVRYADIQSEWTTENLPVSGGAAAREAALARVPGDAVVAASPRLTPHLSHRREIYSLPLPFLGREEFGSDWSQEEMGRRAARVRWVLFDVTERPHEVRRTPELLIPLIPRLGFREVARHGTIRVYVRSAAG